MTAAQINKLNEGLYAYRLLGPFSEIHVNWDVLLDEIQRQEEVTGQYFSFDLLDTLDIIKERSLVNQYHGRKATIIDISFDDASSVTGDPKGNFIYKVELENGEVPDIHFWRRDIVHLK